jgi:hypothetical protein
VLTYTDIQGSWFEKENKKKGFGEVYNIPFVISISFPSDDNCKYQEAKKILVRFTTYLS